MSDTVASIKHESRDRYLTYALSVVTSRALPDVRDGLKPVHRRILYTMFHDLHLRPSQNHRKSAAVVGAVLARYHPHSDVAVYDAMVRMAQSFSLRYPLVDGQGNFGSLDGDAAAAYRYTEARLLPIALDLVGEIDEETVNFRANFDSTTVEPEVLPSKIPHLLLNGASGIAVGMATNIPPHNLKEICSALLELSNDPDLPVSRIATLIKGPDFPTGCDVLNSRQELIQIYQSGKGTIRMRATWKLEEQQRGKDFIIVTSVPYGVQKSQIVEKIADIIINKKVPQLTDVRDESTDDVRIVLELASGASAETAMAYLFKNTPLEMNFYANFTALTPTETGTGKPELLSLKACLQHFLDFREIVVQRRLVFERKNLLARIHILEGLVIIFDALDEALKIVRSSKGREDAALKLQKRFKLSDLQAYAVVDMRIYQLAQTNIEEVKLELKQKAKRVAEIDALLKSPKKIAALVRDEITEISAKYGDKRKSAIVKDGFEMEFDAADYVVKEDVFAILTKDGWLKRIRQQNDITGTRLREGDSILRALATTTLDSVLIFTNRGNVYNLAVNMFPSSSGYGEPIQKLLRFKDGEKVIEAWPLQQSEPEQGSLALKGEKKAEALQLLVVSRSGLGYVVELEELASLKKAGRRVMKLRDGDEMIAVSSVSQNIFLVTEGGFALSISRKEVPVRNTAALGVILIGLKDGDSVVGAASVGNSAAEKKGAVVLDLEGGKTKQVSFDEIPRGKRALKGKRVVGKGTVLGVRIA